MSILSKLWNPFSGKVKDLKSEAKDDKSAAMAMFTQSVKRKAMHEEIYHEQKRLADELRREQRRNHFSDLFQTTVPIRHASQK